MASKSTRGTGSGSRPAAKAVKPASKPNAKPAKPAAKPAPKAPPKPAPKPSKPAPKPEPKATAKPVPKSEPKATAKPAAAPDTRSIRRVEKAETRSMPRAPIVEQLPSPYPASELREWRKELIARRSEVASDVEGLEKDAMEAEDGHTTPNHIAERGSDADLQDLSLGLAGEEKGLLWQIDRALRKIETGKPIGFGLCEYTRQAIPKNRLQLMPWTPLSIEGATHCEQTGLAIEDVLIDD